MSQATIAIIIILFAIISFALEKIPLPVTAMLAALAMGIFKIIPFSDIYSGFSNTSVMMVAGMLVIGNCIFESGLATWLGKRLSTLPIVKNERCFLFFMVLFSAALSAFLSNSAVVAVCIPLVGSLVLKSEGRLTNKNIIMGIGMASAIGGACTMVGSTAQLAAQQVLEATEGCRPLEFFELSYVCGPLCLVLAIYFATFGYHLEKKFFTFEDINVLATVSEEKMPWENDQTFTWKMGASGIVMILCILGFIMNVWNVAVIALTGATILLLIGCMDFKKAMRIMDWNTIIILGAVQGFAKGLDASGGGKMLAEWILSIFGGKNASPFVLLTICVILSTVLTNFMSNTAVLAMLTPIFINIGFQIGIQPEPFILACIIGGSTALATPIGTPSVTQTLVAGYRFTHYVKIGLPITIILTIGCMILCPLVYGFTPL